MIFNEIYSAYYNTVAKIISEIIKGNKNESELNKIVCDNAFAESILTVLPSLKSGKWQLITPEMTTPIKHIPSMPLTELQLKWLKAIALDPRVKLFGLDFDFLGATEPLFTPDDYVIYDKYSDGDPFCDEDYINNFKTVVSAIKSGDALIINSFNRNGKAVTKRVIPINLEYSEKDDKFRLISKGRGRYVTFNLGRIISCKKCSAKGMDIKCKKISEKAELVINIRDERNALERAMLHFAHFEKNAERIDKNNYRVILRYDTEDETELVIRILGFGPLIEVEGPEHFRNLIKERLINQKSCEIF